MLTKDKVRMSTWLRSRDSKVFIWRMTTIYNPASKVMWLYSISCSNWLTCELKLRLERILAFGVGTVKSFFGEWPLSIILSPESFDCILFPIQIGIHSFFFIRMKFIRSIGWKCPKIQENLGEMARLTHHILKI